MDPFISISSGAYIGHPLHVAFDEVAKIGGTHLELIFIHGFSNPFEESFFCDESAKEVRKLYSDSGLKCGAFAAHMNLSTPEAIPQFIARMDFAKAIGAHFMITYAAPMDREVEFYKNMELFVRHAEEIDMVIAFENPGDGKRNIIDAARSGAKVIERLGSDYVKFNYDFGNLMTHFREDVLPEEDFLHVLDNTVHLHVKESKRIESGWSFPAVGKGDIDFKCVFQELKDRGIALPFCLEVPVTQERDVYGIPKPVAVPPTLEERAEILKYSLDYTRELSGIR